VGPRGIENKHKNPGPQAKAKDNEHHRATERDGGYQKVAGRVTNCANAEAGITGSYGTSPRESSGYNHVVGGGKEEHGPNTCREHNNPTRGGHSASTRGANRKSCAGPRQRKGTYTQVP
jgi:hypothetical protein